MRHRRILTIAILLCGLAVPAPAQDTDDQNRDEQNRETIDLEALSTLPMPQRERDLIEILSAIRRNAPSASDKEAMRAARLQRQIEESRFMREDAAARDWIGIVEESHTTKAGDLWLMIDIAPGIRILTAKSHIVDADDDTLIAAGSALYDIVSQLRTGQAVRFSATFEGGVIAADEDMVKRPEIQARFILVTPH